MVHDVRVPFAFRGQDLTAESDEDPAQDWNPQFEGVAVDEVTGTIYAGRRTWGSGGSTPRRGPLARSPS
jgi:3-phytase